MTQTRRWVLYDDGGGRFGPMTDLRCFAEARTGAMTALERMTGAWGPPLASIVPEDLADLAAERGSTEPMGTLGEGPVLLVNARWRGSLPDTLPEPGERWCDADGATAMATLEASDAAEFVSRRVVPAGLRRIDDPPVRLYHRPWEVLEDLPARLVEDLEAMRRADGVRVATPAAPDAELVGSHPVDLDPHATLGRGVVLDATDGPIRIAAGASVGHLSVLRGPIWIGPGSIVADRTRIKSNVAIGPVCKVGGEIGATIFQGHANKVHDGHLGDSWIGEWVNVGAGTTNSNLLNTYGEISMRLEPDGPSERSGRTALGCIVGDHVKFAILVRIMTGSSFGTGSMVATVDPPRSLGRFRWLTDRGDATYRLDRFLVTMTAAQARRGVVAGPAYLERLRRLHDAGRGG